MSKPIDEIRLGAIKAAVWRNDADGRNHGPRFNVTFQRLYRDGEQWKSTDGFGRDDLLTLAKVADRVHSRIHELQQAEQTAPQS